MLFSVMLLPTVDITPFRFQGKIVLAESGIFSKISGTPERRGVILAAKITKGKRRCLYQAIISSERRLFYSKGELFAEDIG